jgi:hypothetical protein
MDVEKVKLIINNMESLLRLLKEEVYINREEEPGSLVTPFIDDADEVYSE